VCGLSRVGRVGRLVAGAVVECDLKHSVCDAEYRGGDGGAFEGFEYRGNAGIAVFVTLRSSRMLARAGVPFSGRPLPSRLTLPLP